MNSEHLLSNSYLNYKSHKSIAIESIKQSFVKTLLIPVGILDVINTDQDTGSLLRIHNASWTGI